MIASPVPALRRLWLYVLLVLVLAYLVAPIFIVIPVSFSASRYL
jgi:putative spermidine/putrescine transport system permease protein